MDWNRFDELIDEKTRITNKISSLQQYDKCYEVNKRVWNLRKRRDEIHNEIIGIINKAKKEQE